MVGSILRDAVRRVSRLECAHAGPSIGIRHKTALEMTGLNVNHSEREGLSVNITSEIRTGFARSERIYFYSSRRDVSSCSVFLCSFFPLFRGS